MSLGAADRADLRRAAAYLRSDAQALRASCTVRGKWPNDGAIDEWSQYAELRMLAASLQRISQRKDPA